MKTLLKYALYAVLFGAFSFAHAADDLKTYYEKQKAEIAPTFTAPALGSEVTIKLVAGQLRSGILMKLEAGSISVMTETGMVDYKRSMMHESSRARFFADDFAHVMAVEKTQEYKQQLHLENISEEQANTHDGRISVSAKVDKSSDKEVEEEERENERDGSTTTITLTTRTYTDIQNLNVTVANNTTHSDSYTLMWYFFGKTVESESEDVHDSGTRNVSVPARKRIQEKIKSQPFTVEKIARTVTSSDNSNTPDARITESGKENAGWLVLLKHGQNILDAKASSKSYLTDEWLDKVQ